MALVHGAAEEGRSRDRRPGPNEDAMQHGGGMTWLPVTYDPELNLIYVTTGNPHPVIAHAQSRRRQPVHGLDRRPECRHRKDGVVFPVVAARHARLGLHADRRADRRRDQRPAAQADRPGGAQRSFLRARSHERQGDRLDRVREDQLVARVRRARVSRSRIRRRSRSSTARWSRRTGRRGQLAAAERSARRPACST